MKNYLYLIPLFLTFTTQSAMASVGVLYKDKSDLLLFEKTGKVENLVDNPARFLNVRKIIVDNFMDVQIRNSKPFDPAHEKSNQDESIGYSSQLIFPLTEYLSINLGYIYQHYFLVTESTLSSGGTLINDADKSFRKSVNAAVATDLLPEIIIGYAFSKDNHENYVELFSDFATNYNYFNYNDIMRHTLGIIKDSIEIFAAYETKSCQGEYNGINEVDLFFNNITLNARYLWGEIDKTNIISRVSYTNYDLNQRLFTIARTGYQLNLPNYAIGLNSFYYNPMDTVEYAGGIELSYEDKDIFDLGDYQWVNYQIYQLKLPCMLLARVLPFLSIWSEIDLIYSQDTYKGNKSFSLENILGVKIKHDFLEINIYAMPFIDLVSSQTEDDIKSFNLGMDVKLSF